MTGVLQVDTACAVLMILKTHTDTRIPLTGHSVLYTVCILYMTYQRQEVNDVSVVEGLYNVTECWICCL